MLSLSPHLAPRRSLFTPGASLRQGLLLSMLAIAVGSSTSACDEGETPELSLKLVSTPPEPVSVEVSYPRIRLPAGVALAVSVLPNDKSLRDLSTDAEISMYSENPKIARPFQMRNKHRFLIVGHKPGEAIFQIRIDDEKFGPLRVEVSDNRPPSER